jgi:hypothetical protein
MRREKVTAVFLRCKIVEDGPSSTFVAAHHFGRDRSNNRRAVAGSNVPNASEEASISTLTATTVKVFSTSESVGGVTVGSDLKGVQVDSLAGITHRLSPAGLNLSAAAGDESA